MQSEFCNYVWSWLQALNFLSSFVFAFRVRRAKDGLEPRQPVPAHQWLKRTNGGSCVGSVPWKSCLIGFIGKDFTCGGQGGIRTAAAYRIVTNVDIRKCLVNAAQALDIESKVNRHPPRVTANLRPSLFVAHSSERQRVCAHPFRFILRPGR